jgi:hypothetical protein
VVLSFQSLWVILGYAKIGYQSACLLVVFGLVEVCYGVENDAPLPLLVLMERKKQPKL